MTEADWQTGRDTRGMLWHIIHSRVSAPGSDRRLRLFACACARLTEHLLFDRRSTDALITAERYARGESNHRMLEQARRRAQTVTIAHWSYWQQEGITSSQLHASNAAVSVAERHTPSAVWNTVAAISLALNEEEPIRQLLRESFGNPFRPSILPPAWRKWNQATLLRMASEIRESERWADMAVLADALEEAGCVDDTILSHCRTATTHLHGCWVLELLLDEES